MENIFGGITMEEQAKEYKIQGSSMMALQNYEKAKEYFEKAAEIENSAELQIDIGNAAASMELYDDAVNAFSQALLLEPDNGEAMFDIGSVYLLQSKFKKTLEYYNRAEENGLKKRFYIRILQPFIRKWAMFRWNCEITQRQLRVIHCVVIYM